MRIVLLTPPMVQFNAPYAATPLLTGFLRSRGVDVRQVDLSLRLSLALFSRSGMEQVVQAVERVPETKRTESVHLFLRKKFRYSETVDEVIAFLQKGGEQTAKRIVSGEWLPEGPRFRVVGELTGRGCAPFADDLPARARYLASLYMDDLADVIRDGVDQYYGLSRYAERLGLSASSFIPILQTLRASGTLVDRLLDDLTDALLCEHVPDVVGITIPFPGNAYAAFRIAAHIRKCAPQVRIAAGGGYVNTEWRRLSDVRVFDFLDFILYDDGEYPLLHLLEYLEGKLPRERLIRTRLRDKNQVVYVDDPAAPTLKHRERTAPSYEGLPLEQYCPVIESPNPMHRLWTEHCWMKLTLAHGCYWHRCAFCDTRLDYIGHYDPAPAERIVEWIEQVIAETGRRDFHFVDEAAPPALLRRLACLLIERGISIRWWTNIRFEKVFDVELCRLMAKSGCVAVTGGMECAEKRLLERMEKGVSLKDMAMSAHHFSEAGILVHAYLMYGFPTQTRQEVVDALEYVRQLYEVGCVQSTYWHRFALTVHSPVCVRAAAFGIQPELHEHGGFSENTLRYTERHPLPEKGLGEALHAAVYNYMHGVALNEPVEAWFELRMPPPRFALGTVARWLCE